MEVGHLPVMPDEVLGRSPAARQPSDRRHARRRWAHRADPGGRQPRRPRPRARCRRGRGRARRRAPRALRRPPRAAPRELPGARDRGAGGWLRNGRRAAVRSRAVEFPAGRHRSRLRIPGRRPARHALRHEPRRTRRRAARDALGRRPGGPVPPLRRGAGGLADREGDRRRARHRARCGRPRTWRRWWSGSCPQPRAAQPDPPGDAGLPGPADRRQRRARRPRGGPGRGARPAPAGRPARRPELPLARGPDRQAVLPRRAARLHLPTRDPGLRLRPDPAPAPRDAPIADAAEAEIDANPRARSARLRAAERLAA